VRRNVIGRGGVEPSQVVLRCEPMFQTFGQYDRAA
jgi:hypothetical protein